MQLKIATPTAGAIVSGLAVLAVAFAGCATSWPLPSTDPRDAGGGALITGHLGDGWKRAPGCVWLDTADGRRFGTIWPPGFSASRDPLVIHDARGQAVARDGDLIRARGGFGRGLLPDACGFGQVAVIAELLEGEQRTAP